MRVTRIYTVGQDGCQREIAAGGGAANTGATEIGHASGAARRGPRVVCRARFRRCRTGGHRRARRRDSAARWLTILQPRRACSVPWSNRWRSSSPSTSPRPPCRATTPSAPSARMSGIPRCRAGPRGTAHRAARPRPPFWDGRHRARSTPPTDSGWCPRCSSTAWKPDSWRHPVQPLAHILLASLNEAAMLVANADDPVATRITVGEEVEHFLANL